MSKFSYSEAIKFGWEKTKNNFLFFLSVLIIIFLVSFISGKTNSYLAEAGWLLMVLVSLIFLLIQILLEIGTTKISLNFVDGAKSSLSDLYKHYHLLPNFLIASIIYGLIVIGGIILLIVPGIIWSIKYMLYGYLIVDKNMSPMEAIKKSGEITQGAKWDLFLLGLLLALINLLGAILLLVGLLVTIPLSILAMAYVYRKLLNQLKIEEAVNLSSSENQTV